MCPDGTGSGAAPQAGTEQAAAPAAAGTPVVYWYAWANLDPAIEKIMATDEFKEHMGGAELQYKGNTDQAALLTAIAGGTAPDGASNYDYPALYTRGATIPVQDMVATSSLIKQDAILEPLWRSAFVGDDMIGIPAIESYLWWGLNYNSKAAEDAGLDPAKPPKTWDETMDWHKALTKKDDAGNLLVIGLDPYDAMANEPDFPAASWGFKWYDEDTKQFDLDNPLMAEAMDTMGEFIRYAGPDQFAGLRQVEGQGTWGAAYNAGVQDMIIEGYWHPGETQIQKPEIAQYNKASWAPVPASRNDAQHHGNWRTLRHDLQGWQEQRRRLQAGRVLPDADVPWTSSSRKSAGFTASSRGWRRSTRAPIRAWTSTSTRRTKSPTSCWVAAARSTRSSTPSTRNCASRSSAT